MIKRMEIVSSQPGAPALPMGGFMPNSDPVQIKNIDGLGPVKADMQSSLYSTGRGELFQGVSTGKRNIVLTLGLNPNWVDQTMTSLRHLLYAYFMAEEWVTLRFISDELPSVWIRGMVESFEPNLFAQDPEIQISILCNKPDFIDTSTTLVGGTTHGVPVNINYKGTVPIGFELHIQPSSEVPDFLGDLLIVNTTRGVAQTFIVRSVRVNAGTYLKLNTVRTQREVSNVNSDGSVTNSLIKMDKVSVWPELSPGPNSFAIAIVASSLGLNWTMGYFNRFGGL